MKKAIVLINALSEQATEDELDVLDQASLIEETLELLGYESERLFMDFDLKKIHDQIVNANPDLVINLVESLEQDARLIHWSPSFLTHLNLPYTGCDAESMYITSNKILAKQLMSSHHIATPQLITDANSGQFSPDTTYIAKPVWEDASVGISDANVMKGTPANIDAFLVNNPGRLWFFEEFIPGREFNISMLGGNEGPEVLPMAEIVFNDYPEGKPLIVGYEAKWKEDSFEYKHTVRRFGVEQENPELTEKMKEICHQCWKVFGLSGYVRVDLRVNSQNQPLVLEINANPCLSPDAGFYAAAEKAGYSFSQVLSRIIEDAYSKSNR